VTNGRGSPCFRRECAGIAPNVLQFKYAAGFPGGVEPGVSGTTGGTRQGNDFAFWWKPSKPWQTTWRQA